MHLQHSLGLVALSSALVADAFLLPSSMSWGPGTERGSASNIDYGSHLTTSSTTKTRTIRLSCPGCSFPEAYGKEYGAAEDEEDVSDNSIVLQFTVSDDGHSLLLNDQSIFTLGRAQLASLYAQQIPSTVSTNDLDSHASPSDILSRPRQLIYAQATRSTNAADGSDASMTDIEFGINALDDETVNVDRLAIRLLGDEDGVLNIVDIINVPLNHNKPAYDSTDPSTKGDDDYELVCEGRLASICRMRAFMEDRIKHMRHKFMSHRRPCPHKMQHSHSLFDYFSPTNEDHHGHFSHSHDGGHGSEVTGAEEWMDMPGSERIPMHGGVDKFRPYFPDASLPSNVNHHFHGHHHHHHGWRHRTGHALHVIAHSLHRVFVSFFIPVLIGIAAGMIASVLGMFVGTVIAWAWIKFVRGGKKGNASKEGSISLGNEERCIPQDDEKAALMKDVDGEAEAPPVYVERE